MKDAEAEAENTNEDQQRLEKDIDKEINKLKYFLEETDELTRIGDYIEMKSPTKEQKGSSRNYRILFRKQGS